MQPAVDAVAIAAPVRQTCLDWTEAAPAAASDFPTLLAAVLTAEQTSAPASGAPAVESTEKDTPRDAEAPAPATPAVIDPPLPSDAVQSDPATETASAVIDPPLAPVTFQSNPETVETGPIAGWADTTDPSCLGLQGGEGSLQTRLAADTASAAVTPPRVGSPFQQVGTTVLPTLRSPGAMSLPPIEPGDEAPTAERETSQADTSDQAAAKGVAPTRHADGEAVLSQFLARRRFDPRPRTEPPTNGTRQDSEGSPPSRRDEAEAKTVSALFRSVFARSAAHGNDGVLTPEPAPVRTSIPLPADFRPDSPPRPFIEAPGLLTPGMPGVAEASPASGAPAALVRRAPAARFIPVIQQIAPVLITLSIAPQLGPARLTLLLEPEELGRIEVAVERVGEGRLSIAIVAERAETLMLLQRDSALLDRALAQAGVGSEGRSLSFAFGEPGGRAGDSHGGQRGPRTAEPERATLAQAPISSATALLDIAV